MDFDEIKAAAEESGLKIYEFDNDDERTSDFYPTFVSIQIREDDSYICIDYNGNPGDLIHDICAYNYNPTRNVIDLDKERDKIAGNEPNDSNLDYYFHMNDCTELAIRFRYFQKRLSGQQDVGITYDRDI